jgi:hypothetical protein
MNALRSAVRARWASTALWPIAAPAYALPGDAPDVLAGGFPSRLGVARRHASPDMV